MKCLLVSIKKEKRTEVASVYTGIRKVTSAGVVYLPTRHVTTTVLSRELLSLLHEQAREKRLFLLISRDGKETKFKYYIRPEKGVQPLLFDK